VIVYHFFGIFDITISLFGGIFREWVTKSYDFSKKKFLNSKVFKKSTTSSKCFCEKTLLFGLFNLQTFGRSNRENPLSQKSGK
jgi:hypothetical protein